MVIMTCGATFSHVCAQFVKNFNVEKFISNPEIGPALIEKFYMNDYIASKDTEEEALEVQKITLLVGMLLISTKENRRDSSTPNIRSVVELRE